MDINFELYKIFYHAAKLESFSQAGQKLFISQSAVSQAVKSLEDKMGCQLFVRKTRSVGLTKEGEILFRHVEQAYNFIKSAESKVLELQDINHGEVRIGASDTVCRYHLVPCMEKYIKLFPKVKIQVVNRTSYQLIEVLRKGLIDFAIVTLPVSEKDIIVNEYISVEDIFVASSKFSFLKGSKVPMNQLIKNPLLMLPKSSSTRRGYDEFFSTLRIEITAEIELESIDLLVEFARIGLGIAHVLKESASNLIKSGELFQLDTLESLPPRKLGIVTAENVPMSRASLEFITLLND